MDRTRVVGVSNRTRYWQHYVFSQPPAGYRYSRGVDIPWHVLWVKQQFLAHTKLFFPLKRMDMFHTYNGIVANGRPWVIEVESYLPRYRPMKESHPLSRWAMRRLASDDCKWILFSSENAARMNRDNLIDHGVDPAKMDVLYRSVERFMPGERPKDHFQVVFVGNGFYRKGGIELLKAFRSIRRDDIRLTIISSMEVDWEVIPTAEQIAWVREAIASDPRITWEPGVPHHEVPQRMRRAHVFVNTTFGDTFNNAVMEAMGCELPVIASDISALPEMITDGVNGWMVPVRSMESDAIAEVIAQRLLQLMDDPALRERMGKASMAVVEDRFDIRTRNARLGAMYDKALS